MAFTGSFGGDRARSEGEKANRNSDRNNKSGNTKSTGSTSTSKIGRKEADRRGIGPVGSMGTQTAGVGSNGKAATKAERDRTASEAAKMNNAANKNSKSSSIPSINKTLTTYKQPSVSAQLAPGISPIGGASLYGNALGTYKANSSNISSLGGASSYGMSASPGALAKLGNMTGISDIPDADFNKTINTDNVNGVIRNLQEKAKNGALTETDKQNISHMAQGYNNQAGLGVLSKMAGGLPGMGIKLAGNAIPSDSYFSGTGKAIASGDLDSSRLAGNEGQVLGNGGFTDTALSTVLGGLSSFIPGIGPVSNLLAGGLTTPAPGTGQLLNELDASAGSKTPTATGNRGGSNSNSQATTNATSNVTSQQSATQTAPATYQPTRWSVTAGSRY